jgi:hypothetical protein
MERKNFKKRKKTIDLINCEGAILKLECIKNEPLTFEITDQWNETVKMLNKEELIKFMTGSISITDSNKRQWNAINDKSLFKGEEYIIEELKKIGVNLN